MAQKVRKTARFVGSEYVLHLKREIEVPVSEFYMKSHPVFSYELPELDAFGMGRTTFLAWNALADDLIFAWEELSEREDLTDRQREVKAKLVDLVDRMEEK